jgi:hypothetical protein
LFLEGYTVSVRKPWLWMKAPEALAPDSPTGGGIPRAIPLAFICIVLILLVLAVALPTSIHPRRADSELIALGDVRTMISAYQSGVA